MMMMSREQMLAQLNEEERTLVEQFERVTGKKLFAIRITHESGVAERAFEFGPELDDGRVASDGEGYYTLEGIRRTIEEATRNASDESENKHYGVTKEELQKLRNNAGVNLWYNKKQLAKAQAELEKLTAELEQGLTDATKKLPKLRIKVDLLKSRVEHYEKVLQEATDALYEGRYDVAPGEERVVRCKRCGLPLTNPESIKRGYGDICIHKVQK